MLTEFGAVWVCSTSNNAKGNKWHFSGIYNYVYCDYNFIIRTFDFLGYRMRDSQYLIQIVWLVVPDTGSHETCGKNFFAKLHVRTCKASPVTSVHYSFAWVSQRHMISEYIWLFTWLAVQCIDLCTQHPRNVQLAVYCVTYIISVASQLAPA